MDDADQTVTVVEINYYLGDVSNVDEEDGTVTVRAVSDLRADGARLDVRDFATTEFAEDDYVVFTIDQNADDDFYICEMMAPETVDGTVTRVNKNADSQDAYLYLDRETRYDYSAKGHIVYDLNDENVTQHPELEEEYTLYLDPNGYMLAYSGDTTQRFLYVEDSDEELVNWEAAAVLSDGTNDAISVDTDIKGISGDDDIYYMEKTDIQDKFDLGKANSKVWLDSRELGNLDYVGTKISNIDYEIFEYDTNDDGDVYTLTDRNTRYMYDVEINNGESYIDSTDDRDRILVDRSTIFVNMEDNVIYTGYDAVPDVSNANIAYLLEDDSNHGVAEIVYIIDGDIYDADAIYFVITDTKRDTEKYDGDYYWEFENMYVDGRHRTDLYVAYDALDNQNSMPVPGDVYKVLKSIDGTYITEIELVNDWEFVDESGNGALWLCDKNGISSNADKYSTTSDTTYVMIEELYDDDMDFDGYDVDAVRSSEIIEDCWDDDVTDDDGYKTMAMVVKADGNTAELVYIFKYFYVPASDENGVESIFVKGQEATVDPDDSTKYTVDLTYSQAADTTEQLIDINLVSPIESSYGVISYSNYTAADLSGDWATGTELSNVAVTEWAPSITFNFTVTASNGDKETYTLVVNVASASSATALQVKDNVAAGVMDVGATVPGTITVDTAKTGGKITVGQLMNSLEPNVNDGGYTIAVTDWQDEIVGNDVEVNSTMNLTFTPDGGTPVVYAINLVSSAI